MPTLHKIAWGFLHAYGASSLENIDDQHSRKGAVQEPTGFLKLEDDFYLLLETGDKLILEATP